MVATVVGKYFGIVAVCLGCWKIPGKVELETCAVKGF